MQAVDAQDEPEAVYVWRLRALTAAGYPPLEAELIACSTVELHLACELVEHGCEPGLAAKILL